MRTLTIFLLLASTTIFARGVENLEQLPEKISDAVAKEDLDSFLNLCAIESVFAKGDSCLRLVRQFMRKKFELKMLNHESKGKAGQVTIDLYRYRGEEKRKVDTIALLCVQRNGKWQISSITERKTDIKTFFDNPPPAPAEHPELLKLGKTLQQAFEKNDLATIQKLSTEKGARAGEKLARKLQRRGKFRPEALARLSKSGKIGFVNGLIQHKSRIEPGGVIFVKQGDTFKADQVTSDDDLVEALLSETIEYGFEPEKLPSDEKAMALMQKFKKALQNKEQNIRQYYISKLYWSTAGIGTRRSQRFLEKARKTLLGVSEPKVFFHKKSGRAVATMTVKYTEEGQTYNQLCYFYLMQKDNGFVIVDHNYGLDQRWFYMQPK